MVIVRCSVPACPFKTADVTEALAIALLANHGLAHTATVAPAAKRGPKLERPKVDVGVHWKNGMCLFAAGTYLKAARASTMNRQHHNYSSVLNLP